MYKNRLQELVDKYRCVVIVKANKGYSIILSAEQVYQNDLVFLNHINGYTIEEALEKVIKSEKLESLGAKNRKGPGDS